MICIMINHNFVNEVQTVTQLFFPGDSFQFIHETPDKYPAGHIVTTEMTTETAIAHVIQDGNVAAKYTLPLEALPIHLSPRRVLMLALYHALQQAVGAYTPWGALTGIRPSKMVREWLDEGWNDQKIVETMQNPFCCTMEKANLALDVAKAERELTAQIYEKATNPIGIYVSVPFCPTRCVYCSFNVNHNFASKDIYTQYITALVHECKTQAQRLQQLGGTVSSIYIGGGTPTVLPENLLEQLLYAISSNFETGVEYSVEAGRPDTLTKPKLAILQRYGVNRIAVNPQTLNDKTLSTIGRKHTAADFFNAFSIAREAGFPCINTDVIVGLPGETIDDVRHTMEGIAALSPENITVHTLAVKRASYLRASYLNETKAEYILQNAKTSSKFIGEMLAIANATCADSGLYPYYLYRQKNMVGMFENIGYSKPGNECLYNVGMMAETQSILGIGAGAVSKFVENGKITREFNVKNPEIYVQRNRRDDT